MPNEFDAPQSGTNTYYFTRCRIPILVKVAFWLPAIAIDITAAVPANRDRVTAYEPNSQTSYCLPLRNSQCLHRPIGRMPSTGTKANRFACTQRSQQSQAMMHDS